MDTHMQGFHLRRAVPCLKSTKTDRSKLDRCLSTFAIAPATGCGLTSLERGDPVSFLEAMVAECEALTSIRQVRS
jgi:hypothetical protein